MLKNKKSRSKKLIIISITLIAALCLGLAAKSINGPSVGEIYTPSQGTTQDNKIHVELDGKNIVFNYPENYMKDSSDQAQPNVMEYYNFKKADGNRPGSLSLSVSVYMLSGNKLEEDGAYRIRKEQPVLYTSRLSSINNLPFTIFKKKDGSETTAFTQDKGKVATISLSGVLASDNQSESEFTSILNSWRWK